MGGGGAALVALWAVAAAQVGLGAARCASGRKMELVSLPEARCADGSAAGYFVEAPLNSASASGNFVVWLGDSGLCSDSADCAAYCAGRASSSGSSGCEGVAQGLLNSSNPDCYANFQHCGSTRWGSLNVTAETVLCGDEGAPFKDDVRVFVPQCSLDWWLGNVTGGSNVAGDALASRFQGSAVLQAVLDSLVATRALSSATRVLLGGTRGGGLGALHQFARVQAAAPGARVLTVLDSSFFLNVRQFGAVDYSVASQTFRWDSLLQSWSAGWIDGAALSTGCRAQWAPARQLHRCLYPNSVLAGDDVRARDIFVLQSQFDILMLNDLGVLSDGAKKQFVDDAAYSQAVLSFVKGFGETQRVAYQETRSVTVQAGAGASKQKFFAPACDQEGYVVPTSLQLVRATTDTVGSAGALSFRRDGSELAGIRLGGLIVTNAATGAREMTGGTSALAALTAWARDPAASPEVTQDTCNEFLCNPTCPSTVVPYLLPVLTSPCAQVAIRVYTVMFFVLMWTAFSLTLVRLVCWRAKSAMYWRARRGDDASLGATGKSVEKEILREAAANAKGRSIQLTVQNLSYWSPPKNGVPYQILRNVSLNFRPGTVSALMGPSGSGKSTLLDLVAYTRDSGRMTGTHYINGVPSHISRAAFLREWLRNSVSYVRQQDVLFPHITVREHLQHAAWLMLPQFMPDEKKLHRVWQVIKLLELDGCADTICGDGGVRVEGGISGGQRRRVSVATQLLKMPAALLLDEPTSGLDSTNALLLVKCLRNLARKSGETVIMTIHQPRKEIFVLLDTLSILVKGRVVFSGKPEEAAQMFRVDINEANVGDTILDVLQAASPDKVDEYRRQYETGALGQSVQSAIVSCKAELDSERAGVLRAVLVENALAEGRWSWTEATNSLTATWVLMSRTLRRGGFDVWRTVPFSLVGGVLVGLVFLKPPTYTSQTALAYLSVSTMTFLQSTFLGDRYNAEKQMWMHELDNGTKVSWVALLGSLFMRNAVTSAMEGLAFALPSYFMGNMYFTPEVFFNYVLLMVLTSTAVVVQNTTVEIDRIRRGGEYSADTRQAVLINMSLLALSALFNGFIIKIPDIPTYLRWVPYCMLSYWAFVGVLINNFNGNSFSCSASALECATRTGDNWIRSFQYDDRDVYQCMLALLVLIVGLHYVSIVDFYLRFAYNTQRLSRGRPAKAGPPEPGEDGGNGEDDERAVRSAKPAMSVNDAEPHAELASGSRGKLLSFLLSRETLFCFFFLDLLTAWYVCFFDAGNTVVAGPGQNGTTLANITAGIFTGSLSLNGVSPVFVILNIAVFGVYVAQLVIQLLFLVPINASGRRTKIVWISFWDLFGLVALALDGCLMVGLFVIAKTTTQQLLFIAGMRLARLMFAVCFWTKVSSFHRARANQFLALRQQPVDGPNGDTSSVHMSEEEREKINSIAPYDSAAPAPPPSRTKNRVSGMFGRAPPPLPPPSRAVTRTTVDLGPQWAAYQQPIGGRVDDSEA
jgi:ABC-type multidrug transport system ATPase subunit